MEALQQFGISPALLVAEIINFLIVGAILYFFVFKKIATFLEQRSETIKRGVENAEQAEAKLAEAEQEKKEILGNASASASAEIHAAIETAKTRETQIISQANERADEIQRKAALKAEEEKQRIIDSSREEMARIIVLGAEKVLKSS